MPGLALLAILPQRNLQGDADAFFDAGRRRADNTNTRRAWRSSGRGKLVEEDPVLARRRRGRLARRVLPAAK